MKRYPIKGIKRKMKNIEVLRCKIQMFRLHQYSKVQLKTNKTIKHHNIDVKRFKNQTEKKRIYETHFILT